MQRSQSLAATANAAAAAAYAIAISIDAANAVSQIELLLHFLHIAMWQI